MKIEFRSLIILINILPEIRRKKNDDNIYIERTFNGIEKKKKKFM